MTNEKVPTRWHENRVPCGNIVNYHGYHSGVTVAILCNIVRLSVYEK